MRSILLLSLLGLPGARAGIINSWSLPPGLGSVSVFNSPGNSNNDNIGGASPNLLSGNLNFAAMTAGILTPVGSSTGGTTEYNAVFNIVNNTGQAWGGLLFEIYVGSTLQTGNGFDFDFPDFDSPVSTTPLWSLNLQNAGQLLFQGPALPSGQSVSVTFNLDYPDLLGVPTNMRITPLASVPEPAAWSAMAMGLGLLACCLRKRG